MLSLNAMGQNLPKGAVTAEIKPEYFSVGRSNEIWNPNQSDTVAVYMLTTFKVFGDNPINTMIMQRKGFSVTPRTAYNFTPRATYLDIYKKPIGDMIIVWMSTPRKEECTCK